MGPKPIGHLSCESGSRAKSLVHVSREPKTIQESQGPLLKATDSKAVALSWNTLKNNNKNGFQHFLGPLSL